MQSFFTTAEVASLLRVDAWRIQRLFEIGALAEPTRFAGKRAIPREMLADVAEALRSHGWLPETVTAGGAA